MTKKSKKYLYDNGIGDEQKFEFRLQRLCKAWQRRMEAPLLKRATLLTLWASGYFDLGYQREHLVNLIDRGVFTIVPYLVEGNPKVMVETLVLNYKSFANTTQLALNYLIKKMNLAENVFIPVALNSMFGAGIVRTFTEYDRVINLDDEVIKSGTPVIRVIDDVDYIGDVVAKSRADYVIEGDIYKLPTLYARDIFSKHADDIMPDCKLTDDYSPEKISSGEWDINRLSLRDFTTFIDIYLCDEGITITIMPEGKTAVTLNTIEEDGPGKSPYDVLGYKFFPGSTYPIPPAWNWHDIDVSMNILARTAREQAESQKDILFVTNQNMDLGEKVKNAKNLDIIPVQNPEDLRKESLGGVNPENYNWMQFAEMLFNKSGGTPEVMRGSGAEANTLGQERMIFQNASRIVNNMYSRFHDFMESVLRKLAWKVWTDPLTTIPVIKDVPGFGKLPQVFDDPAKVGDFYDFIFSIVPYSTQRLSPEMKYQRLMQIATQWLVPTMPLSQQQGAEFNIPEATERMGNYLGFDDFGQLYKTAVPKETDIVPYMMQPNKSKGQMSDSFGAMLPSREANSERREEEAMSIEPMTGTKI